MEKEFVTYELSLRLKALGFDEPCFGRYYYKKSYPMLNPQSEETELVFEFGQYLKQTEITILAPTFSQAFRWFREKYDLGHMINGIGYESFIMNIAGVLHIFNAFDFKTYEEAELACLDKLIEIVEQKEK